MLTNTVLLKGQYIRISDEDVEGALCSCEEEIQSQNFDIYNMNKVMIQNLKYVSFHN